MAQEEIIKWLEDKRKENEEYYSRKDICQAIYKNPNDLKGIRALRRLVAYDEIEIKFKLCERGGLTGGFMPCYRAKKEESKA